MKLWNDLNNLCRRGLQLINFQVNLVQDQPMLKKTKQQHKNGSKSISFADFDLRFGV